MCSSDLRYATALAATALVGGLWLAVDAAPAAAQSVRDQVLAVTRGTMELGGAKVALGTVAGDDARFTVTGSTITQTTEGKTSTVTIGTITFIGAKPTADGGFTADEIDLDKVAIAESDGKGSIEHAAFQRVTARTADVVKRTNGFAEMVEAFDLTGVVVVGEDGKAIPIAAVHGTSADWVDGFPHKGSFEMRGLVVPFDPKDEGSKELTALGYTTASVDLVVSGTWDDKVGRLDLTQSTSGADMGALEVALTVGGLTRDVVTKMRDAGDDQIGRAHV